MTTSTTLTIPGVPRSKGNSGRILKRGRRRFIMPSKVAVKAEKSAREHIREQWQGEPMQGAVRVDVTFFFKRPKKNVDSHCLRKVDRGNLLKLLEDAGNEILWLDDSQIVCGNVAKEWTTLEPRTVVEVRAV